MNKNKKKIEIVKTKCLNCGEKLYTHNPRYYNKKLLNEEICQGCMEKLFNDPEEIKFFPVIKKYNKNKSEVFNQFILEYCCKYGDKIKDVDIDEVISNLINNVAEYNNAGGYDYIELKIEIKIKPEEK